MQARAKHKIVALIVGLGSGLTASAGASSSTRSIIVFDNSGSMRQNDPQRLAQTAAMLYIQLSKPTDEVGLVVFSKKGRVAVPLGPASAQQSKISQQLTGLKLNGALTDIGAALEAALDALDTSEAGVNDIVVLLTDGRVDLGIRTQARTARARRRLRTDLLERYRQQNVRLYTIAFTPSSDRRLMEELAARTQGAFWYIESAEALHRAFTALFTEASGAMRLPVRDGLVVVDPSIKQTSLVISKKTPTQTNALISQACFA
ncbi:MAG: vWA domain-containing protein [Myxococcota bacterium]